MSIELPVTTRHCHNMTEILLKVTLNQNKQTNKKFRVVPNSVKVKHFLDQSNHTKIILFRFIRAVPDEKIWGSLKAKHYIFVGVVGVSFSIQWVVVFHENVIL